MKKIIEEHIELMPIAEIKKFYKSVLLPVHEIGMILANNTRNDKFMVISEGLSILVLEDLVTRLGMEGAINTSLNIGGLVDAYFSTMSIQEIKEFYTKVYIPMYETGLNYAINTGVIDHIDYMMQMCFIAQEEYRLVDDKLNDQNKL